MRNFLLVLCLVAFTQISSAQPDTLLWYHSIPDPEWRFQLLLGLNSHFSGADESEGRGRKFFEVGLHRSLAMYDVHHPSGLLTHGPSVEFSLGDEPLYGFKYGSWLTFWMFSFGLDGVYYTDLRLGDFRIRPMVGFGSTRLRLALGFNLRTFKDKDFDALQQESGQVTLNYLLGLRKGEVFRNSWRRNAQIKSAPAP